MFSPKTLSLAFLAFIFLLPALIRAQPTSTDLQKVFRQLEQQAGGRLGMAATLLESGQTLSYQASQRFPMQSVYKFPIGMAVLRQVDLGKLRLDQTVRIAKEEYVGEKQHSPIRDKNPGGASLSLREILRYAVSESDGTASDVLLRIVGGAPVVMAYLKGLGVTGIIVKNTEKEIGSADSVQYANWAQPEAVVTLLKALHEGRGLSQNSRALLLRLMTETPTGLNRLKGRLPVGTRVAHKTGTSRTVDGKTAATNDVGIITLPGNRHLAVAVFVSDARTDEVTRENVIAQVAKILWDHWQ